MPGLCLAGPTSQSGVPSKGPLFLLANGQPLTHAVLVAKVRLALSTCGMGVEKYSGHSF